jgi:hypothetical protein
LPDNEAVDGRNAFVCVLLAAGFLFGSDKGFNPPPAGVASAYPAHEAHENEKVTIAVDPFTSAEKASSFKVKYKNYGFLPVRLIITNDGDKPLMLQDMKVYLVTAGKDKIEPATREDIFRRISHPEKAVNRPAVQLPIPVPRDPLPRGRDPLSKDARDEAQVAMFQTVPVTPHSTNSGFLFFDVLGLDKAEQDAHLYLTGIKSGTEQLFYFDIPLHQDAGPR